MNELSPNRRLTSAPTQPYLPLARRAVVAGVLGTLFQSAMYPRPGRAGEDVRRAEPMPLASRALLLDGVRQGDRVIAVGERGHVLESTDSGQTWAQAKVPTRVLLTAVTMVGSELAWAVGHGPVVLHSQDGGTNWVRQHLPESVVEPLLDVWFADERQGVAIGAFGRILTTEDGGDTWCAGVIDNREPHANAIVQSSGRTLYVAAEFGMLFASVDVGRSWTALDVPHDGSFFGILNLREGPLLAYGLRGRLFRSSDGGLRWGAIETGTSDTLLAGMSRDNGAVLLGGLRGILLLSRDGGLTFETKRRRSRHATSAIVDLSAGGILLLGEGGFEIIHDLDDLAGSS